MLKQQETTNVRTAYILSFVSEIYFPIAIWLFFYNQYLSFAQIALLSGIGGLASILLEIPTGAFADIFGRRIAIVISYIAFTISMLGIAYSHTLPAFIFFAILAALSNALYSGSLEALVYDSLKENNDEDKFEHVTSRMEAYTWIGLFVGSVIGGFLYQLNHSLPYFAQAFITALAGVASLKLVEPSLDSKKYHLSQMITQNLTGFKELFHNRTTTMTSLMFIVLGAGYYVASQILGISQAKEYGISPSLVGILFGAGYAISATASYLFPAMKRLLGNRVLLVLSATALISSFLFARYAGVVLGAALIVLRISSSTTFRNSRSITFNAIFSSRNRATALSTLNLLSNIPYVLLAYFIGDTIDKTSPNSFAFTLGIVMTLALGIVLMGKQFLRPSVKK